MAIDDDDLLQAVRNLNAAKKPAHADHVLPELRRITNDVEYSKLNAYANIDAMDVADALADLEARGRLRRVEATEWAFEDPESGRLEYSDQPLPKNRIAYVEVDAA